jgi:hypothetical protein
LVLGILHSAINPRVRDTPKISVENNRAKKQKKTADSSSRSDTSNKSDDDVGRNFCNIGPAKMLSATNYLRHFTTAAKTLF